MIKRRSSYHSLPGMKNKQQGVVLDLSRKQPNPYVNHYYFHIMDGDWGHVTVRMSSHPPFPAQIILNGHAYVAQQARKQGLDFQKEGNCFTDVADAEQLAQIADTLRSESIVGQLQQVCQRWLPHLMASRSRPWRPKCVKS
jgi:hypothetical protein